MASNLINEVDRLYKRLQDEIILEEKHRKAKRDQAILVQRNDLLLNQFVALQMRVRGKRAIEDEYKSLTRENEALSCENYRLYEKAWGLHHRLLRGNIDVKIKEALRENRAFRSGIAIHRERIQAFNNASRSCFEYEALLHENVALNHTLFQLQRTCVKKREEYALLKNSLDAFENRMIMLPVKPISPASQRESRSLTTRSERER